MTTLTAINDLMFDELKISKVLVIAPLRVASETWPSEIKKWDHLKEMEAAVITGTVKQRIAAVNANAFIYIVNRENVKWLIEYYEKNGLRWDFQMVVIDELSSFKNYQSQRFKWLRKVRPFVKRWVGLTGTPTSNGLLDLWSEIGILDGGERLGRFIGRFRESYFKPSSMNPSTGVVFSYVPRPGAEQQIYDKISDITISMKALDYLDMPECIYVNHLSEHNGSVEWNKVKANFVILRAGFGCDISQKDDRFEENYAGAKARNIPVGAYWYSYAMDEDEARQEADVFIATIKGKQFEYPVFYDVEESKQFELGKEKLSAIIRAFLERVEAVGYFVGLYGSASSLVTHTENDIKEKYTIWLAHWCENTNYKGAYGIWQHSCKGKVDGISGDVDLDKCYVDYPERIKAKGLNGYGTTHTPAPLPDDSVSVEVTVDGKKYSGKLNKA